MPVEASDFAAKSALFLPKEAQYPFLLELPEDVSSAGLRIIKLLHMAMRKKNGELVVTNVNRMVMEVFEMTGFAGLLKFE